MPVDPPTIQSINYNRSKRDQGQDNKPKEDTMQHHRHYHSRRGRRHHHGRHVVRRPVATASQFFTVKLLLLVVGMVMIFSCSSSGSSSTCTTKGVSSVAVAAAATATAASKAGGGSAQNNNNNHVTHTKIITLDDNGGATRDSDDRLEETETDEKEDRRYLDNNSSNNKVAKSLLRAEIVSTNNCHLDLRPALKEFLLDPTNGAQSYHDVNVVFLAGHRPVMTIFDDTTNDNVVESIQLWNIETTNELHEVLKSRGFVPREESSDVLDSDCRSSSSRSTTTGKNPKNDDDTTAATNKAAAMEAARNAFRQVEKSQPGTDTYTKSYAAMRAYLDATSKDDRNVVDTKDRGKDHHNQIDLTNSYYEMAELIHERLQDDEQHHHHHHQQQGSKTLISQS